MASLCVLYIWSYFCLCLSGKLMTCLVTWMFGPMYLTEIEGIYLMMSYICLLREKRWQNHTHIISLKSHTYNISLHLLIYTATKHYTNVAVVSFSYRYLFCSYLYLILVKCSQISISRLTLHLLLSLIMSFYFYKKYCTGLIRCWIEEWFKSMVIHVSMVDVYVE